MSERHPTDETRTQAALYALGLLEGDEARHFEAHLGAGCQPCRADLAAFREVAGLLALEAKPIKPAGRLRAAVLARATAPPHAVSPQPSAAPAAPPPGFSFVHAEEGAWMELAPGVTLKVLRTDLVQARGTALMKVAAGARYAPHRHGGMEEIYVVEGTCHSGGRLLKAGDYQWADADTIHEETSTDTGCLLLVMFSLHNRPL